MDSKPIKLFITYAHEDTEHKQTLETHLAVMKQNGEIQTWTDNEMESGDAWRKKIDENLNTCDLLLYLTSARSLASKACNEELAQALNKDMAVIPILLDHRNPRNRRISDVQILPRDEKGDPKPICEWDSPNKAWQAVTDGIRRKVEEIRQRQPKEDKKKTDAQSFFQFGNTCLFLSQFQRAIDAYTQSLQLNPNIPEAYNKRGIAKVNLEQYEGAFSDFNEAIRLNPKYATTYTNRGIAKGKLEQYEEAIADFDTAIDLDSEYTEAYFVRGIAKAALERYEEAIADYNEVIRLNPKHASAYLNRGRTKVRLGQYEEAIADFDTAIDLNPEDASAYFIRGYTRIKLEQYEEAIADYNEVIRLKPEYPSAYFYCGIAKAALERYEEAIADFDTTIDLNPEYADAYFARGNVKVKLGRYEEAIADYNEVIRLKPEYPSAYKNRGFAKRNFGQHNEAIADYNEAKRLIIAEYDKVIHLNPKDADAYVTRGNAKAALGRHKGAVADFDTAINLNPEYASAYFYRGNAKDELEQYEEAIMDFDETIRLNPNNADAYITRGNAKDVLERYEEAIADYGEAIRLDPEYAYAYCKRGNAKGELGQYEEAVADYTEAIRLDPEYAYAYCKRGNAKNDLEQYKELGRRVRQNLERIFSSNFLRFNIDLTKWNKDGTILALLGDDQGLARMREIATSVPTLKPLVKAVDQHQKDRRLFQAILDAVATYPLCLQTKVKTLVGETDGRKVARLIANLEKAGKIVRLRLDRTYMLLKSDLPEVPETPPKRVVGPHRTHQKSPMLHEIDVSSLSYVSLPRTSRQRKKGQGRKTISDVQAYFEVHDAAWQIAMIENIPIAERPDTAFRRKYATNSGLFMIGSISHAKRPNQIQAAALRYDRVGELVTKRALLDGIYRVSVHPFGQGLIAMSRNCVLHAYDDYLEPKLKTDLKNILGLLTPGSTFNMPKYQLKNHIRCISLSQKANRYVFTIGDIAWCVDMDGNGIWGRKFPVPDGWIQNWEYDKIYATCFATGSDAVYLASYSGRIVLIDENGKGVQGYNIGSVPHGIFDTGDYLYLLSDTRLYVFRDDTLHTVIDTSSGGGKVDDIIVVQTGFGLLEKKCLRWFQSDGQYLGSVVSKDPIRRVYWTGAEMVLETRQRRAIIQGPPKWWE